MMGAILSRLSAMWPSPTYWGIHTSLYSSLPPEAVQLLEQAIWLKIAGRAAEARATFENALKPFAAVPVVAIEHADFELESGKWGRAWRILDSRLTELRDANEDLDTPEHRLMALTWAMLGTRHRGDISSSAKEIERTQHWLAEVHVADYTDIQASCIRRYVIASLFTRLYSGYNNPEAEHIPTHDSTDASGDKIPWGGLPLLRRALTQQDKFNEANALFRVEMNRTPLEARSAIVEEFLEAIEGIPSSRGRDYIEAAVRLQSATTFVLLQAPERALEEFNKSEAAFERFCVEFGIEGKKATPHMQALTYERLSCIDDPIGKLDSTTDLATQMEAMDGTKTGLCLSDAADLAMVYYNATSMEVFHTVYFDMQRRLETYDQTVSEDICDLVQHHVSLFSVTNSSLVGRNNALEWIDAFFEEYPHFDAPGVRALLCRSKATLLRGLRRLDEANEVDQEASLLEASGPKIGEWMHVGRGKPAPKKSSIGASGRLISQNQAQDNGDNDVGVDGEGEDKDEPFYWGWRDALGDERKTQEMAVQLVLEWLSEDIARGSCTPEEIRGMTEAEVKDIVFITTAQVDKTKEELYNRLCTWLENPPKGQRNRRLFCLVMLRFGRQMHFSTHRLWDLRISELHHLLELEERLPRSIRENFPGSKGSWLGQMALTWLAPLDDRADLTSTDSANRLSNAEMHNDQAVDEYRRNNDLAQLALQQRSGAQICMLQIMRLRQLAQHAASSAHNSDIEKADNGSEKRDEDDAVLSDETVTRIAELRDRGIRQAKEADEIFSQSELHASSSSGLEGITHRQNVTAFNSSAYTVRTAMQLLLAAPGQPSAETITEMWRWTQKFKARSLARTIGVRISDPPALVTKIKSCPDAAQGYEQMLAMQRRIDEAEGMAKFNLRRELNEHLRVMRGKYDSIRQLLDLKEAQPFDLSDVATIEAQSGASIVLVDWFHLPGYIPGDADRLLLFTVRGQSHPTMDILTTRTEDVIDWQKTYLTPDEFRVSPEENLNTMEAREAFNTMLGGLVAPLARHVRPKELVVLCPSSSLHRLPLHALAVERYAALIHRNPVVYTHSQSLLRSCFVATQQARPMPARINALFISGIAKSESEYLKAGRDSIVALAHRFGTEPMIDQTASKEIFLNVAGHSRLLHLHTHCNWKSVDPLDHEVEFPMPHAPPVGKRPVESVTAREFFDVQVLPGTHVNMIACQGGVMDVQLGDEVMGLVPALMCSGASSTISTLWSIRDTHGVMFENGFFRSFLKQCAPKKRKHKSGTDNDDTPMPNGSRLLDLAKAMQQAAKEMDEFTAAPLYKWAGYVLHGCWQFPLSQEDMESLQSVVTDTAVA